MNAQRILEKARALDVMIEIFTLTLAGNEPARLEAAELIRKLDPAGRRDLRAALQDLDNLLDDVTLAEMRERRPWKL
jgi:hypothetical protein